MVAWARSDYVSSAMLHNHLPDGPPSDRQKWWHESSAYLNFFVTARLTILKVCFVSEFILGRLVLWPTLLLFVESSSLRKLLACSTNLPNTVECYTLGRTCSPSYVNSKLAMSSDRHVRHPMSVLTQPPFFVSGNCTPAWRNLINTNWCLKEFDFNRHGDYIVRSL